MEDIGYGIATWLSTGLDDLLVILLLMAITPRKMSRWAIGLGTLLGTMVMFLLVVLVRYLFLEVDFMEEKIGTYTNLVGVVPILMGLTIFERISRNKDRKEEKITDGPLKMLGMSFVIYMSNSLDDWAVNFSLVMQREINEVCWLGIGNLIGASAAFLLARWIRLRLVRDGELTHSQRQRAT